MPCVPCSPLDPESTLDFPSRPAMVVPVQPQRLPRPEQHPIYAPQMQPFRYQQQQQYPPGQPYYVYPTYYLPQQMTQLVVPPTPQQTIQRQEPQEPQEPTVVNDMRITTKPTKRKRKKYHEVERLYKCNYGDCTKAYGTLNHLNCHIALQKHGKKRLPSEFKELREQLKKRRWLEKESTVRRPKVPSTELYVPGPDYRRASLPLTPSTLTKSRASISSSSSPSQMVPSVVPPAAYQLPQLPGISSIANGFLGNQQQPQQVPSQQPSSLPQQSSQPYYTLYQPVDSVQVRQLPRLLSLPAVQPMPAPWPQIRYTSLPDGGPGPPTGSLSLGSISRFQAQPTSPTYAPAGNVYAGYTLSPPK